MDQRICIKFCVKNGIKCSNAHKMLTVAFGESTMSQKSVYKWYKRFTEGRENVKDDERPGVATTSTNKENIEIVKKIVLENRQITIREVAEIVGISIGSCHAIFSDIFGMKRDSHLEGKSEENKPESKPIKAKRCQKKAIKVDKESEPEDVQDSVEPMSKRRRKAEDKGN